jgi:hypothetical protein
MEDAKVDVTKDDKKNYKPNLSFYIAGVQHHPGMKKVCGVMEEGNRLLLIPEPSNKFDPNAVRIEYAKMDGEAVMLGYVPKIYSSAISASIAIGKSLECILVKFSINNKPWEMAMVEIREVSDV